MYIFMKVNTDSLKGKVGRGRDDTTVNGTAYKFLPICCATISSRGNS